MSVLAWVIQTFWPLLLPLLEKWWGEESWLLEIDSAVTQAKNSQTAEEKLAASKRLHDALRR